MKLVHYPYGVKGEYTAWEFTLGDYTRRLIRYIDRDFYIASTGYPHPNTKLGGVHSKRDAKRDTRRLVKHRVKSRRRGEAIQHSTYYAEDMHQLSSEQKRHLGLKSARFRRKWQGFVNPYCFGIEVIGEAVHARTGQGYSDFLDEFEEWMRERGLEIHYEVPFAQRHFRRAHILEVVNTSVIDFHNPDLFFEFKLRWL